MRCLKCGRETGQTFCQTCREEMDRYPVKPGTIIQLPKDRSNSYTRRSLNWRDMISPETQIENQKRTIRRLSGTVAALVVLVIVMGFFMFRTVKHPGQPPVGQNYSTVTKATELTQDATEPTTATESGK